MSLMTKLRSRLKRAQSGIAAVEFALTLPIWLLLFIGGTDIAYMMLISQRIDRIAYSVTDIATQSEMLTQSDVNTIFLAASQLMNPFPFGLDGVVILTSVQKPTGEALKICWQRTGGGSLARTSKVGLPGTTPLLPANLTLGDNQDVIIAEVFYAFEPLFINAGILSADDIYRVAVYKPRLSALCTEPE